MNELWFLELVKKIEYYVKSIDYFVWNTPYLFAAVWAVLVVISINIIFYKISHDDSLSSEGKFIIATGLFIIIGLLCGFWYIALWIFILIALFSILFFIITIPSRLLVLLSKYEIRRSR